jgi:hypothetical protein
MVTTDADGKLDVQVPPGDYTITPVVPETIRVYGAPFRTSVHARGCAPVQFSVVSNGRIEGRIVQRAGVRTANAYSRTEAIAFVDQPQEDLVLSVRR